MAEGFLPLHAPHAQQLLAAWVALLHRYTQQETLAFDVSVASLGAFAVALSVQVSPESEPDSLLEAVSSALPHAISVSPTSGSNTAITILDASELAPGDRADEPWVESDYDLQVVLWQRDGRLQLSARYNALLFKESTVRSLAASFAALLAGWGASSSIQGLPLFSREEERSFTAALDCPRADYPQRPVWQLISERATKTPEAPAAYARGEQLSYGQLEARSNQLANWLLSRDVGPGNVVAVCLGPSLETLVAMLAIWKVRGVYVPLDPTHPRALVERMLQESSPAVVLTASAFSELSAGFPQLLLDALDSPLPRQPGSLPVLPAQLDDVAYVFYTSGTTGKSKGVVATQRNLVQYVHSAAQRYGFQAGDVFSAIARTTFSISLFELVSPLCCGGSVRILQRDEVLTPERLCSVLSELTVFHAGPSLLATLFRYLRSTPGAPRAFPGLRHASSGGDLVPPSVMEELKTVFPNAELFVIYGCTEVSCMGTTFRIERDRTIARSFVGRAFPNVRARVLDAALRVVPSGVVGEICFSGPGVVRGYFDRPELTAEKFVDIEGERYYRTGDVGRLHADGELEILGRRDFQVQLRGIRIELAGIERTILELGLAAQCAVVAKQVDSGDLRLIAFVVKPTEPRPAAFRRVLSEQLPDYAIPAHVVTLDAMPLTANGKLDRNQLAQRPLPQQSEGGAVSLPSNERELKIAEIFAKVLGVDSVGVESSFFELGGDSLLGVAALQEIQRSLGVVIAPQVLFQSGTVRALAAYEENVSAQAAAPILLNRRCDGPTVFFLSGIHTYRELARCLDGRCNAYGVFAPCELESLDTLGSSRSVEELAAEYVALLRAQQPTGPYNIVGYSFAGIVAYEVARQLRESGQSIGLLSLIDAMLPEWSLGWRFRRAQLRRLWSAPSRDVASWLLRRLRRDKTATADFLRYQHDQRLGPLENARNGMNQSAAEAYLRHVPRYQGAVTLFVSEKRVREDPLKSDSCGWAPYVDSLQIERLDADHFKMMSKEPFVSQMAKTLDRCLGSLSA